MDSVFEDKQNRVLVMTRKGIYEGCPKSSWTTWITLCKHAEKAY